MHVPIRGKAVSVVFKAYDKPPSRIVSWRTTLKKLREDFGAPHEVVLVLGNDENQWAWELESGQRIIVKFKTIGDDFATLLSDPLDSEALDAIGFHDDFDAVEPGLGPSLTEPSTLTQA